MDYEESFASAPVRYALDDHDSDEEREACDQIQKVVVETKLTMSAEALQNSMWTLVFGLSGPGSVYAQSLEGVKTENVGTLTRTFDQKEPEVKANLAQVAGKPVMLVSFVEEIQGERAWHYSKAVFNKFKGKISNVVVLDAFASTDYTSEIWDENMAPPMLRVLQTSTAPVVKGLTLFEVPNMIKGLSASVTNYCEIYSIPCYTFLTLQEYVYGKLLVTAETLEAYSQGFHLLGLDYFKFNVETMNKVLARIHTGRVDDSHHRLYL